MLIEALWERLSATGAWAWPGLVDVSLKGLTVLALTALVAAAMRRASAAARHAIWLAGMVGLLVLPFLSTGLPGWRVLPPWATSPASAAPAAPRADADLLADPPQAPAKPAAQQADFPSHRQVSAPAPILRRAAPTWQAWVLLAWLTGTALCLGHLALGFASLWRLERRSVRIVTGHLPAVLADTRAALGCRRAVRLLSDPGRSMPMIWGLWRPRVLLPESCRTWTVARSRMVLLHELAHARRWDCLAQIAGQLACAMYWFNPLIWVAARRMDTERERACDDLVLEAGTKASSYAEQLLHIAAETSAVKFNAAAIAMARSNRLERRLRAILEAGRSRRRSTWLGLTAAALVALAAVPLAMLCAQERAATTPAAAHSGWWRPIRPARTFNSKLHLLVAVNFDDAGWKLLGTTPAPKPLEIPACNGWWVTPVGDTTVEAVATVLREQAVPEVIILNADDADMEFLKDLPDLQSLNLAGTHVTDAGLKAVGTIKHLRMLHLGGTRIDGSGLEVLKGLHELVSLEVSYTTVGDDAMKHILALKSLVILKLGFTQVTDEGMTNLKDLPKLQWLNLNGTSVGDAGLEHFRDLKGLRRLFLEGTPVTDEGLKYLKDMQNLEVLQLSRTSVSDKGLENLEGLTHLWRLWLEDTNVTDAGLVHLKGLTRLRELKLGRTAWTDAGLEQLQNLRTLETLDLAGTDVTDVGLEHLQAMDGLRTLDLSGTRVTDEGMKHLQGLKGLRSLNLTRTLVTAAGLQHLKDLKGLQSLQLASMTDDGMAVLDNLHNLETLNLTGTAVTDAGLKHLEGLSKLQSLDLSRTAVTDSGLGHLAHLEGLQTLNLGSTGVTDAGMAQLKPQTNLQMLILEDTVLTDDGIEHLMDLKGLTNVYLNGTQVTPAGRAALKKALPNCAIH